MGKINSTWRLYLVSVIPYVAGILIGQGHDIFGMVLFCTFCFFNYFLAEWIKKG